MRTIRYVRPNTQNVPLFVQEESEVGRYQEQLGLVVDDQFLQNGNVVLDGTPFRELNQQQRSNDRPTIFALGRNTEPFQDSDQLVNVQFSPIPQQEEQRVFEENRRAIFGGDSPFVAPADGGNRTTGNQTAGNRTTGNQSSFDR